MAITLPLQYTGLDKPTLPYRSNTSPIDDSPHWITGSQNGLATVSGWMEKRAGFSAPLESALSALPGTVQRLFGWQRWAGSATNPSAFIWMASVTTPTTSLVYKLNLSTDPSFVLLHSDEASESPFDFVCSNNFVFFGNGTTRENMRKYDGTDDSLWGIDPPTVAPVATLVSGTLPGGLTFNPSTGTISGTPNATGSATITATVTDATGYSGVGVLTLNIAPAGAEWLTPAGPLPPAQSTLR